MRQKTKLSLRSQPIQDKKPKRVSVTKERGNYDTVNPQQQRTTLTYGALTLLVVGVILVVIGYTIGRARDDQSSGVQTVDVHGVSVEESFLVSLEEFANDDLGLSLSYDPKLSLGSLSNQDVQDGFIARLSSNNPPIIVSVRVETGLRTATATTKTDVTGLLRNNIDRSLPSRYPEFDLEASALSNIEGKEVLERTFSYVGPRGEPIKQRMLAIIKDDDTAVYISMQTAAELYESVFTEFFAPIEWSIQVE